MDLPVIEGELHQYQVCAWVDHGIKALRSSVRGDATNGRVDDLGLHDMQTYGDDTMTVNSPACVSPDSSSKMVVSCMYRL